MHFTVCPRVFMWPFLEKILKNIFLARVIIGTRKMEINPNQKLVPVWLFLFLEVSPVPKCDVHMKLPKIMFLRFVSFFDHFFVKSRNNNLRSVAWFGALTDLIFGNFSTYVTKTSKNGEFRKREIEEIRMQLKSGKYWLVSS